VNREDSAILYIIKIKKVDRSTCTEHNRSVAKAFLIPSTREGLTLKMRKTAFQNA